VAQVLLSGKDVCILITIPPSPVLGKIVTDCQNFHNLLSEPRVIVLGQHLIKKWYELGAVLGYPLPRMYLFITLSSVSHMTHIIVPSGHMIQ
jgi:hypothetical protein